MAMSEIVLIVVVVLMLFGAKNIPEIARNLGKGMAQIKNATNEIKNEIHKSADIKDITNIKEKIQTEITSTIESATTTDITTDLNSIREDIENITGPIKRMQ